MKSTREHVLMCAALLALVCTSHAAFFYVAKTGNDSHPGTQSQPFLTVQKGINTAQAGDTVLVGSGYYEENLATARSGSQTGRITVDGQGVATLKQFSFAHAYNQLINATVSGNTQQYSRLVHFDYNAHHSILSNNVLDAALAPKVYGIEWRATNTKPFGTGEVASDNLIVSNTVKHVMAITLMSVMGDRNLIHGNQLLDSGQADFFRLFGRSNIISGNVCSNNYVVSGLGNHPDFIQTFGNNGDGSWGHIIEGNLVIHTPGAQITQLEGNMVPEIGNWVFRNNIFANIGLGASCSIPDIKYFNNVFYRCGYIAGGHALNFGPRSYGGENDTAKGYLGVVGLNYPHGTELRNNVFLDCGDSRDTVGWYALSQDLTNVWADYNYVGKLGYAPVEEDTLLQRSIGDEGGWATWGKWWEDNGINGGDPLFRSELKVDFRLRVGSPLIGNGMPLNHIFTKDLAGVTRGERWDIGPLEFVAGEGDQMPMPPRELRRVPQ
jgi:hypothetical protein